MKTPVVSFYSDIENNDYYSQCAEKLTDKLESFKWPFDIAEKESLGSYKLNCLSKPRYILEKLNEHDSPILWVDVDSLLHGPLYAFEDVPSEVDFVYCSGVFYTDDPLKVGHERYLMSEAVRLLPPDAKPWRGIRASPLYFGNTIVAREFLSDWINLVENFVTDDRPFDHEPLIVVMAKWWKQANVEIVGREFCQWPNETRQEKSVITMGLADNKNKKNCLMQLGWSEAEYYALGVGLYGGNNGNADLLNGPFVNANQKKNEQGRRGGWQE